jgi:hypothetical protein
MTEAVLLNYRAVVDMAHAICRADKGDDPDAGYDAQPSYERARYNLLAEAALAHVADQHGLPAMEPVPGAGWRPSDRAVAVGDPSGGETGVPDGFEQLYRIVPAATSGGD